MIYFIDANWIYDFSKWIDFTSGIDNKETRCIAEALYARMLGLDEE